MTNPIVNVTVNIISAPAPETLQATGAIISQGGTDIAAGTATLITQPSDLAAVAPVPLAITSQVLAGGTVTVTTAAPHNLHNGDVDEIQIAGAVPAAYSGVFACTITGASTFTYALAGSPGSCTTPGTWVSADEAELSNQVGTFFDQGSNISVYVLELGEGTANEGVAALNTWIGNQPTQVFYRYLVPAEWDANAAFLTFVAQFESTGARTYFHVKTTVNTYASYTAAMKCVLAYIDAPTAPASEFGAAWPFWVLLNYNPGPTNKVTPLAFSYGYGITPYPLQGNGPLFTALKNAKINWAGTGAQGNLSNVILFYGTTMDGRDGSYWYGVDWVAINVQVRMSAAIIEGSNSQPPLDYDQDGINTLQQVGYSTLKDAITFGMLVGTAKTTTLDGPTFNTNVLNGVYAGLAVINAIPFTDYLATNPSDYPAGIYSGFSVGATIQRGFIQINFTINFTDFA